MKKLYSFLLIALAGCSSNGPTPEPAATGSGDAAFNQLADEYLTGYLAWRPLQAMQLGFHEYDGKLTDYSRGSVEGEIARLKAFDLRLDAMNTSALSPQAYFDFRNLRSGIRRELFGLVEMGAWTRNPMT